AEPLAAAGADHGNGDEADREQTEQGAGMTHHLNLLRKRVQGAIWSRRLCSMDTAAAVMRAAMAWWISASGVSGRRTPWPRPSSESTALTGIGLGSTDANSWNWASAAFHCSASARRPARARSHRRRISAGTMLDTTETTPSAPASMAVAALASSPPST